MHDALSIADEWRKTMKRTSNDFIVGLTVLVTVIAVVAGTLWVQQADIGQRRTRYEARFRDVGNAQVGSAVVIRGVQAGRIESIELTEGGRSEEHPSELQSLIRISYA